MMKGQQRSGAADPAENGRQQRRPGRTPPAVAVLATALLCLPLLAVAQFLAHARVDEFDSWLFAYYGRQLLAGHVLYEQLWDNKPPGIFWLNALALWLSRGSLVGPIVFCAVAVAVSCALFFAAARRLYGLATAAVATVMATLFLNQQYFHVGCNRPNTFFVLTELAALGLYVRGLTGPGRWRRSLLAAGFCAGLGLWFKQSAVALAAAVGIHQLLLLATRVEPPGATVRRLGFFGAGYAAAVVLAGVMVLATSDAGWAWQAVVSFNRDYFGPGVGSKWWPQWFGFKEQVHVLALPGILTLATLVHAAAMRFTAAKDRPSGSRAPGRRPPLLLALLWIWLAAGVYLALLGPHRRLPYFAIALPPLCMLAAHGVHLFLSSGRSVHGRYAPYYLFLGLVWFAYMMITPLENQLQALNLHHYRRFEDPDPDPDRRIETAGVIAQQTAPDDRLFVWQYDPEVYWRADRPSAIRYIATEKAVQLGAAGQPIMDDIIALLREAHPKTLVISVGTLDRIEHPRAKDPLRYNGLAKWIRANYRLLPEAPRRNVWLRTD